jgi:hypothetical protein
LTINVHEAEKLSLEQIEAFLNASAAIRFEGETPVQIYRWVETVLARQEDSSRAGDREVCCAAMWSR